MRRLSSNLTPWIHWGIICTAALACGVEFYRFTGRSSYFEGVTVITVIFISFVIMAVGSLLVWWYLSTYYRREHIANEVFDAGACLVVRQGSVTEEVAFKDILKVVHSPIRHPSELIVHLNGEHRIGREFRFLVRSSSTLGKSVRSLGNELTNRSALERAAMDTESHT